MSDGLEESVRECERECLDEKYEWRRRTQPDDYCRNALKIAVAQVCEEVGFDYVKQSALEALSNVMVQYICDLGKSASFYANLAGRSDCNVFDTIKGLEDFGASGGFSGASEVRECVVASGVVEEIAEFVGREEEISFAQPIPRFPVVKCRQMIPSFSSMGEIPIGKHIPDWLPAFPDPHTYMKTPVWPERKKDIQKDKGEHVRQRRKAERSLLNLQQRILSCALAGPSGSTNCHVDDERNQRVVAEDNAYLAPPLPAGTQYTSVAALPPKFGVLGDKKQLSVRETFAPVIEALKSGVSDPMDFDRTGITDRRPVVHFKLKAGKKMLVEDLDVHLRNWANKRSSGLGRDDDKDDKKKRAVVILRQSMENFQEQSQM